MNGTSIGRQKKIYKPIKLPHIKLHPWKHLYWRHCRIRGERAQWAVLRSGEAASGKKEMAPPMDEGRRAELRTIKIRYRSTRTNELDPRSTVACQAAPSLRIAHGEIVCYRTKIESRFSLTLAFIFQLYILYAALERRFRMFHVYRYKRSIRSLPHPGNSGCIVRGTHRTETRAWRVTADLQSFYET